jgi:glycosyltransferase involved in cell wall biosynthesis
MTNRPRILALFGARVIFGQERANIAALAALRGQGCEVLCVVRPETWPDLLELRAMLESEGLSWTTAPYIDYPLRGWLLRVAMRNPGAYLSGNAALKRIARDFRATHVHAFNPLYVASFYGALRALKIPMVYRAGDKPVRHNAFYRWIWRFVAGRAAVFVADSHYVQGELTAAGVDPAKIIVLHPPPPRRPPAGDASLPEPDPEAFRFAYVGRITRAKGVDLLVEAFRRLAPHHPRIELLIAGPISDWAGDAWARELRSAALSDPVVGSRVRFLGRVADAPGLMSVCDVHVAPSVDPEAFGLVVAEAKSVGRPSIIFPSGGMAELVEDGVDGTIVAGRTVEDLASAMERYLASPGLAGRQGANAEASLAKLQLDRFATTWREVYDEVAVDLSGDA